MKSIYRKVSVAFVVALALCAIAAATASASQWYVGGKALSGSEKLSETVKLEENVVFTIHYAEPPKYELEVTCTTLRTPKAEITAPASLNLEEVVLEGCKLTTWEKGCELWSPNIVMRDLDGTMSTGTAPEDKAEIANTFWFEFNVHEEACRVDESLDGGEIRGTATLKTPKGQTEATEQEFVGVGEASKGLKMYSYYVYLTGKFKLKLASGKAWSFH